MRLRLQLVLLLTGLIWLAVPGGVVRLAAAQTDALMIGGDYEYLTAPAGTGYRWCEQQCRSDARCKAWTFLKDSGQCRLKRFATPVRKDDCCISGVSPTADVSGERDICADYANAAVADQEANLAGKCGYLGDEWSDDYKRHFRACLDMSATKRRSRMRTREQALKSCTAHAEKTDRDCDRFASLAAAVDTAGRQQDCRLEGEPWLGGYKAAFEWCSKNREQANEDALVAARGELTKCLVRGGGPFDARCDGYAKTAVEQFGEARKAECGYKTDSRWSDSYRDHYQWCLKVDSFDIRNESEARTAQLDRCLAESGSSEQGKVACDHYARLATEQTRTNRQLDCGLKGRRWLADFDRHFAWCIATSKLNRQQELTYREGELDKCFQRGGGAFSEVCDSYATRAVGQSQQNVESGCRFRGVDWSDSYLTHYNWCKNAKPGEQQKKLTRRKQALETCRIGVRLPLGRR